MSRVVKFEAAAGSGKTHQLTLEYLRRIFRLFNDHIKTGGTENEERLLGSVLAITFTNKAANEMKERILSTLKRFALHDRGFPLLGQDRAVLAELGGSLSLPEKNIAKLATHIIEIIISHYNDFNVKTIDSLMSSIIKVISPDLGLPPDFEIGLDVKDTLSEGARHFIEHISQSDWDFMKNVLVNIKHSESLHNWSIDKTIVEHLVDFYNIALSKGNIKHEIFNDVGKDVYFKHEMFRENLAELLAVIRDGSEGDSASDYISRQRVTVQFIRAAQDFLEGDANLKKINAITEKTFFQNTDTSQFLKGGAPDDYRQRFDQTFKKTRNRLADFLYPLSFYRVHHFSQFLSDFVRFWESEREKIFVSEFSRTIREKLAEWEKSSLPYIYLKLSDRFRHFLFDEFQDTSELQFNALVPILEEVLASDEKSSLFIVGDRKQAIYRWRGGNAELMDEQRLKNEMGILEHISPAHFTRSLDHNWRSQRCIVDFNNRFWSSDSLRGMLGRIGASEKLISEVEKNFENAGQKLPPEKDPDKGFVNVLINFLDKSDEASRIDKSQKLFHKCLDIIKLLKKKGYRGSDIAILTRYNKDGREIVSFLANKNIPTVSDESLFLSSAKVINEIISFFRFIDYPPDNLSFYTFISGDIFKIQAQKKFPGEMTFFDESLFIPSDKSSVLYKHFKELFPKSWDFLIEPFVKQAGFYPPYDIFQDITQLFNLYENFPGSAPFLLSFGSILHKMELEEINSISSFITKWEENVNSNNPYAIDMSEDETRIRVMTVHKAKGLEFPVVIVPFLDKIDGKESNFFWQDGHFFHITKDFARICPELGEIYCLEIERNFIDELNLLYVALTRAKEALFVPLVYRPPSQEPRPSEFKTFRGFSEIIANSTTILEKSESDQSKKSHQNWQEFSFGELVSKDQMVKKDVQMIEFLRPRSKHLSTSAWKKEFLIFSPSVHFSDEVQKAVIRGEAIHRVLARIESFESREEIPVVLKPFLEAENLPEEELHLLTGFLNKDEVFSFFYGDMEVHNECLVAGMVNGQMEYRRIDRLVIRANDVYILDFKTGYQKKEEYPDQIKEYQRIIQPLFPDKRIRGYLLFVDTGDVEEIRC